VKDCCQVSGCSNFSRLLFGRFFRDLQHMISGPTSWNDLLASVARVFKCVVKK
jgi:hypothetical protein